LSTNGIHFIWEDHSVVSRYRSGVSLHSHTLFSKELMAFIPRYSERIPILKQAVAARIQEYRRLTGRDMDFTRAWWTPPLPPREAYDLEAGQIEKELNLAPMVSLSDHDNIEAGQLLHVVESTSQSPISVEWTVPFGQSFFHIGLHNLPEQRAQSLMDELAAVTADPREDRVRDMFAYLTEIDEILIVFNHPMWDEKGIGLAKHRVLFDSFLGKYGHFMHALELNGWRMWHENKTVIELSRATGIPLISGGDRHGREPNANVNLTNAATFSEFVAEIRKDKFSEMLFLPQYRESRRYRVVKTICDILRHDETHEFGWSRWSDRIFYRRPSGEVISLTSLWASGCHEPAVITCFVGLMGLLESNPVQSALRYTFLDREEVAL
jgi:hypothetical protein